MCLIRLDEYGKKIKAAAKASGADSGEIRRWLRFYSKVRKRVPVVTTHYHRVRSCAEQVLSETRELEQILLNEELLQDENAGSAGRMREILNDLEQSWHKLDFDFLISQADQEIMTTLQSIVSLGSRYQIGKSDPLIFQSEVENLISLVEEALEKEKPGLFELAAFGINHTDAELKDLSHSMQLELVHEKFMEEFVDPVRPVLQKAAEQEKKDFDTYLRELTTI